MQMGKQKVYREGHMWQMIFFGNCSIFECEWDISCDIGEYLDYENCKCSRN